LPSGSSVAVWPRQPVEAVGAGAQDEGGVRGGLPAPGHPAGDEHAAVGEQHGGVVGARLGQGRAGGGAASQVEQAHGVAPHDAPGVHGFERDQVDPALERHEPFEGSAAAHAAEPLPARAHGVHAPERTGLDAQQHALRADGLAGVGREDAKAGPGDLHERPLARAQDHERGQQEGREGGKTHATE
jgi:hypothetical protein